MATPAVIRRLRQGRHISVAPHVGTRLTQINAPPHRRAQAACVHTCRCLFSKAKDSDVEMKALSNLNESPFRKGLNAYLRLGTVQIGPLGVCLSGYSQTPPAGRLLASNCFQCHGTNGRGPGFDKIAGESASEIYNKLREFRSGKEGNGIMARHAMECRSSPTR